MGRPSRPVFIYDRASGKMVREFPNLRSASAATGKPADQISAMALKPMGRGIGWFAWSYDPPKNRRVPSEFSTQSRFFLVNARTGECAGNLILFRVVRDIAECLGSTLDSTIYSVQTGKLISGGSNVISVFAQDPRLAKVSRWDPDRGLWFLSSQNRDIIAGQLTVPFGTVTKKVF